MRLVSCDIENFGGLHRYHLDFSTGLTVIREENGFGKTTLAEFIQAMFYGFPGRAGRTVDKNNRKKHLPWQGGSYGGSLVFSHDGKTYRIDRFFGTTAKGDSFSLFDAETMEKSPDFTENIGLELFQLDADSFARSTYLPQLHDSEPLTTDVIQAKLGDLVDDTNDVNNYEKAISALKAKRSAYIPYRGSGGSIAQAQSEISALQLELALGGSLRQDLREAVTRLEQLKEAVALGEQQRTLLREQITKAAQAEADRALLRQYSAMQEQQASLHQRLESLHKTYSRGLPGREELEQLEALFDSFPALRQSLSPDAGIAEAEAFVKENKARFSQGLPSSEELNQRQTECRAYISAEITCASSALSQAEQAQMQKLLDFFAGEEPPVDAWIDAAREQVEQLNQLCSQQTALQKLAPSQDRRLEDFFAAGLPQQEQLQETAGKLQALNRLREENTRLAAGSPQQEEPVRKRTPLPLMVGIVGVLAAVLGVVMLTQQAFVPGSIFLGLGAITLIGAVYLSLRQSLNRAVSSSHQLSPAIQAQLRENEQEMAELERDIACFTARYPTKSGFLQDKFSEIQANSVAYIAMTQARSQHEAQCQALNDEIDALAQALSNKLEPYFETSFDDTLTALRMNRQRLEELKEKQEELGRRRAAMEEKLSALASSLSAFLRPLMGEGKPEQFGAALDQLQQDCARYLAAKKRLADWQAHIKNQEETLSKNAATLERLCQRYGLTLVLSDRSGLRTLQQDVSRCQFLVQQYRQGEQACEEFRQAHGAVLDAPPADDGPDPEQLKKDEAALSQALTRNTEALLRQQNKVSDLRTQVEALPEKEDALEALIARKKDWQHRCDLLDQTVSFLEHAKQQLSSTYLGTLRSRFSYYAGKLLNLNPERFIVTASLDVRLDCQGQPRELPYFSAGEADMLQLCMRLALVDALFREAEPFLILDDPFVNLDDKHTEQAIRLLQELGQQHQILYLTCNSSRCPAE